MLISPVEFAKKTGISYEVARSLCLEGKIKHEVTSGNHIKIYSSEVDRFNGKKEDYVSKEDYEAVIRENERLKAFISQLKIFINNSIEEESV